MQKWKLIISGLFAVCVISATARAETTTPIVVEEGTDTAKPQEASAAPVQQHIIDMMQDDFSFEKEKKALTDELVLEKLRSEIQKAKGISVSQSEPIAPIAPVAESTTANEPAPDESQMAESVELPKILLVSEIAGISRVAVSANNAVKLVKLNENFVIDGHKFVVFNTGRNMPSIKEVTQ